MSSGSIITILGISIILVYGLTKILEFVGVGIDVYGSYLSFYVFLLISSFILPREYPKITISKNNPIVTPYKVI
jgi:branched-subunit amino acid ABC-type transport system permease component